MRVLTPIFWILGTVMPVNVLGDTPPSLSHNPFSRPSSEVTIDVRRITASVAGPSAAPVLRATMVSTANRFANVEGHILKPGDEIQGYRIIEIHEDYAVFYRGDKTITVFVKPDLAEDDE